MVKLDFILISLLVFMIISGGVFGLYRSLRILVSLTVSTISSLVGVSLLLDKLENVSIFNSISGFVNSAFKTFTNITIDQSKKLIIFLIIFIFTYLVIYYIVSMFGPKKLKILSMELDKKSRIYGLIFGLFSGVFLSLVVYIVFSNLYIINDGFLTKLLSSLIKSLLE